MKSKIFTIITILTFLGCNTHKEFSIPQKYIYIAYKDSNNIGKPAIASVIAQYKEAYKDGELTSETRNDTTFYNEVTVKGMRAWKPWRYESRFKTSTLQCAKKLRIDVERLSFYFCLEDVKELAVKLSKSNDEHTSKLYTSIHKNLSSIEEEYDTKKDEYGFGDSYFLSRLIRSVDFDIKDSGNEHITEVRVGDVNTGWSTQDELFLLNPKKDTVAAFYNMYLIQ